MVLSISTLRVIMKLRVICNALNVPVEAFDLDLRIYENRTAINHALQRGK